MARIDEAGWIADWPGARRVVSPNCDDRPAGVTARLAVVHNISLPPDSFGGGHIEALFTNTLDAAAHPYFETIKNLKVSAHFLIRREGELIQFVSCEQRAWHAGVSVWRDCERCNDYSIGIELEGSDAQLFADSQYTVLADLLRLLHARYPLEEVVGHSDIAPGRKTDPGPFFEWPRLRQLLSA